MTHVRIPPIANLETAIRLYYSRVELSTADVKELFPSVGKNTIAKLKQRVREVMAERNVLYYNARCVNTRTAYEVWGLNVNELEENFKKLQKLKITEKGA